MLIWINGAFGSGKTQTAYALCRRIPGPFAFDPENTGFFLWGALPEALKGEDLQDIPLWRRFNRELPEYIAARQEAAVIVPMTATNRQ